MIMKVLIAFLAMLASVAVASAKEVYVESDAGYVAAPYEVGSDAIIILEERVGPRVYGWTSAPADCGTFKYWNGEYCADARFEPPRAEY
jgi:hypothetical protein